MNLQFRQTIRRSLPPWMVDRLPEGFVTGYSVIASMAILGDLLVEGALQALQSAYAGGGTTTTIPCLAKDRGFVVGPMQSAIALEQLIRDAFGVHATQGNAYSLSLVVSTYVGQGVPVWSVNRAGQWTEMILGPTPQTWAWSLPSWTPESSVSTWAIASGAWNWDGTSNPERAGWFSDFWLAIQDPEADAGKWGDNDDQRWGEPFAFGHQWAIADVVALCSLLRKWTPPHAYLDTVVWYRAGGSFAPGPSGAGHPTGLWGGWAHDDGTGNYVASRDVTCCYWSIYA